MHKSWRIRPPNEGLDRLFTELPVLKDEYDVHALFKEIFDTAPDPAAAEQQLAELRARIESLGLDFSRFWTTCYDNWKTGILNYFDGHYTSAAVEGFNNKARVITKRCYGVKSSGTLWNRLILDLNRASDAAGQSSGSRIAMIGHVRADPAGANVGKPAVSSEKNRPRNRPISHYANLCDQGAFFKRPCF